MSRRFSVNGDSNGDEQDGNGDNKRKKRKRNIKTARFDVCVYKKGLKRAKKLVISPFNKLQKLFKRDTRRSSSPSSPPSNSNLQSTNNNDKKSGSYSLCCLCMSRKPQTVDISSDDIDPNDPKISYGYLKSLLENNDFYSKECNTHLVD